jgi:hypothetical protein
LFASIQKENLVSSSIYILLEQNVKIISIEFVTDKAKQPLKDTLEMVVNSQGEVSISKCGVQARINNLTTCIGLG